MLYFDRRLPATSDATLEMAFTFEERERGRLRFVLPDGRDAAFIVERGSPLVDGECLSTADNEVLMVKAKPEPLMEVQTEDSRVLARAAYHLGNRHVRLEVGYNWLRLPPDHVLRDMLLNLGVSVHDVTVPYQPEMGAYGGGHHHSHHHGDDDDETFNSEPRLHQFGEAN